MPVWAAILIALFSGSAGAWLTTWNDRRERFRSRLIEAADDFTVAASAAFIALREARDSIHHANNPADPTEAVRPVWAARDEMLVRSARVDLLFGPGSETGLAASGTIHAVGSGAQNVRVHPMRLTKDPLIDGPEKLREFQEAASENIRRGAVRSAKTSKSGKRSKRSLRPGRPS